MTTQIEYAKAKQTMRALAAKHGFEFNDGGVTHYDWLMAKPQRGPNWWQTDGRTVAYHDFLGTPLSGYVCWERGRAVFCITEAEIVPFLKGEIRPTHETHPEQPRLAARKQPPSKENHAI